MKLSLKGPSEKDIENSVLHYLTIQREFNILAFKINTTGIFDAKKGIFRKSGKYVIPGTPDILACMDVQGFPVFVGLEVKSDTGRQSIHQQAFEIQVKARKGFYFIIRSVEEAKAALYFVKNSIAERLSQI